MHRLAPFIAGAAAGFLVGRERRRRRHIERLGAATLESLLKAIDANNPETGAHVRRVADYALILGSAASLDEAECHNVEWVALFHDVGKLDGAVSDLVQAPKELSTEEREAVRLHPERGAEVLGSLASFYPELPAGVLAHHERWDGSGYPRGLAGEAIPLSARIVAIADTFDAITHGRVYSEAQSIHAATDVIAEGRGVQFDPALVDLFLSDDVIQRIAESMKRAAMPRDRGEKRRRHGSTEKAPDINFRWRR